MSQKDTLTIKRVGITGANGHVGANVVRLLLEQGYEVRCLVYQNSNALEGLDVELFKGSVNEESSLKQFCKGLAAVLHCAGFIGLAAHQAKIMHRVNVEGTQNLVNACLENGVKKLVYVSSVQAFVPDNGLPLDEKAHPATENSDAYSYTKQLGEQAVRMGVEKGLDASIVNPTAIIGPFDFNPGPQTIAILKIANRKIPALMNGGFDWVDARDVAKGIVGAMKFGEPGENYLLSGHWRSFKQIATAIAIERNHKPIRFYVPISLVKIGAFFAEMYAELSKAHPLFTRKALDHIKNGPSEVLHDKANKAFNYNPRPFQETISQTMDWLTAQKWIKK